MTEPLKFIYPDWPAPSNVRAVTTTRQGGYSLAPYDSFNLADHVGDDPRAVAKNRQVLSRSLALPREPVWLRQIHGTGVVDAANGPAGQARADGSFTDRAGVICAVLTADCAPVLLCDRSGSKVAVLHAGWRGLAAGIVEKGVAALGVPGHELLAWLGPAIGPGAFEVGHGVREAFVTRDAKSGAAFRKPNRRDCWLADLYTLVRLRLQAVGANSIYGEVLCTYTNRDDFFSYRRDQACGRMASLIWMENTSR